MRGGVIADEEEKKFEIEQEKYLISGLSQDVNTLVYEIESQAQNPLNFYSVVIGGHEVSN